MNILLEVPKQGIGESISAFFSSVGRSFSSFGWTDAIDILFLTVLLFFLFRFVINRKSSFILIGVVVCLVCYAIATMLGFSATTSVFHGAFRYGLLALLILFQPELRELFERVGAGSVNGILSIGDQKKKKQLYYRAIDNICLAVDSLSASKTGALIVVSRSANLDDIVQTGIVIDAEVNSFLLRNLFFNKAPLHDGAVIIKNARIEAAGCLLPLSRRNDVDSDLGTRHRAALGMSESSDAIVIVVSEETGVVSVAFDCSLSRGYTQETLRRFLQKKLLRVSTKDFESDAGAANRPNA